MKKCAYLLNRDLIKLQNKYDDQQFTSLLEDMIVPRVRQPHDSSRGDSFKKKSLLLDDEHSIGKP